MRATRESSPSETSGTRCQERAHTSRDLHHRDTMKLRRDERCVPAPQGLPVPVRETSGTRRQERAHRSRDLHHRDTMKLRRDGLFRAASVPLGMLTAGTRSWHLGILHTGQQAVARRGLEEEILSDQEQGRY